MERGGHRWRLPSRRAWTPTGRTGARRRRFGRCSMRVPRCAASRFPQGTRRSTSCSRCTASERPDALNVAVVADVFSVQGSELVAHPELRLPRRERAALLSVIQVVRATDTAGVIVPAEDVEGLCAHADAEARTPRHTPGR